MKKPNVIFLKGDEGSMVNVLEWWPLRKSGWWSELAADHRAASVAEW